MLSTIIKLITFIPWICYFVEIMYYRIAVYENLKLDRNKYFNHINKNLFESINMKELVLFFLYVIFLQYKNTLVLELYFSAMYLYLLVDFFHGPAERCKKIKNKYLMVETVILISILVITFIALNHLYTTYNIMCVVSILSAFLLYGFNLLYSLIKKK